MTEYGLNVAESRIFEKLKRYIQISPANLYWMNRELYVKIVARPRLHRQALNSRVLLGGYVAPETDLTSMSRSQLERYAIEHYRGFTMSDITDLRRHPNFVKVIRRKKIVKSLVKKGVITREEKIKNGSAVRSLRRRSYAGIRGTKYAEHFSGRDAGVALRLK